MLSTHHQSLAARISPMATGMCSLSPCWPASSSWASGSSHRQVPPGPLVASITITSTAAASSIIITSAATTCRWLERPAAALGYQHWGAPGTKAAEPNNRVPPELCVVANASQTYSDAWGWADTSCGGTFPFICKLLGRSMGCGSWRCNACDPGPALQPSCSKQCYCHHLPTVAVAI